MTALRPARVRYSPSALKEKYRAQLGIGAANIILVHLTGDIETILARVGQRQGHYMKAELVQSQFDALEAPTGVLSINIKLSPEEIVQTILRNLPAGQ